MRLAPFVLLALPLMAQQASDYRITVLSTNLAGWGMAEWGFAALVEAGGKRILFDTGAHPETVLQNARALKIDLTSVVDVVLSHHHGDHTSGLITLRRELRKQNPAALSRAWVGEGIFNERGGQNPMVGWRKEFEALGGTFEILREPRALAPGLWLTGPVPRKFPERNWGMPGAGGSEDTIPEDMSLLIDTPRGVTVLTGCGHAGIVNIATAASAISKARPLDTIAGGMHLFPASEETIRWTGDQLKSMKPKRLLAAHCTGVEAAFQLRQQLGLTREAAPHLSVGAVITAGTLNPGPIGK